MVAEVLSGHHWVHGALHFSAYSLLGYHRVSDGIFDRQRLRSAEQPAGVHYSGIPVYDGHDHLLFVDAHHIFLRMVDSFRISIPGFHLPPNFSGRGDLIPATYS